MSIRHTVKSVTEGLPHLVTGGVPGERAGTERLLARKLNLESAAELTVESNAFAHQTPIPQRYAADGENVNPPLTWRGAPAEARSLVVVVEDPDAPTPEPFVHWLLYGLAPSTTSLPERAQGLREGKNSMLKNGWTGCAPPKGDTAHHYHFQVFALDTVLDLEPGAGRGEIHKALADHVLAFGETVGTYVREK